MARSFTATARLGFPSLPTTSQYALHLRFRTTKTANANGVVLMARWSSSSRNGPGIFYDSAADVSFQCYDATTVRAGGTVAGTVNDGNWHDVVFNFNGTSGQPNQLWLDGVASAVSNATAAVGTQNNITVPWNGLSFWDTFVGDMADLAMWDGISLTDDEAVALGKGFSPALIRRESLSLYVPWVQNDRDICGLTTGATVGSPGIAAHARVMGSPA